MRNNRNNRRNQDNGRVTLEGVKTSTGHLITRDNSGLFIGAHCAKCGTIVDAPRKNVETRFHVPSMNPHCPWDNAHGRYMAEGHACPDCHGEGWIAARKTMAVADRNAKPLCKACKSVMPTVLPADFELAKV